MRIFAVTQITASFLLLAGAGALMKTLLVLEKTQPPFETAHVLAVNLPVMSEGKTPKQVRDFYQRGAAPREHAAGSAHMSLRVSAFPGATAGPSASALPSAVEGARAKTDEDLRARFRSISPGFFETLGVPIVEGRDFRDTDRTARSAW